MKATLEFNLPEDNTEYLATVKAMDMANFIFELVYNTRKGLINQLNDSITSQYEADGIDIVFEKICELLDHHNIEIDELI
jgi:glycine cleavage system regulatory protein